YIRQQHGAQSVIPAKRGKKTWRVRGVRAEMRRAFPNRLYRRPALIESVFSSVKRKLSARAPGHRLPMQIRQNLLLRLSFNLYVPGPDLGFSGGGGGIRTPETLSSLTVFKTAGFNRSPTPLALYSMLKQLLAGTLLLGGCILVALSLASIRSDGSDCRL